MAARPRSEATYPEMPLGWVGATLPEFERELIRARTRGGRAHAKANGPTIQDDPAPEAGGDQPPRPGRGIAA
jgi:hypothetical protein